MPEGFCAASGKVTITESSPQAAITSNFPEEAGGCCHSQVIVLLRATMSVGCQKAFTHTTRQFSCERQTSLSVGQASRF